MRKLNKKLAFLVVLIPIFFFQFKYLNDFPSHTHAWAQADHYALSIGFTNNGMNFFKPETFVLNHQFPNKWKTPDKTSITPVDFPINNYIPALIMKIFNSKSPLIYRLYILLYSIIGLFFLFRIGLLLTKNTLISVFIVLFASTSSVYVFYQSGFLPSIPSISNVFIGYFFYMCWLHEKKQKLLTISVIFITIAALSRTPFNIFLIAVFCLEILKMLQAKNINWKTTMVFISSFLVVLGYFLYNKYLFHTYGSIFLNKPLPPENFEHAKQIISLSLENWKYDYFSKYHYLVLALTTIVFLFYFFKRKKIDDDQKKLLLLIAILFVGTLLYSGLMLKQFVAHDYYFLDTFYIPIIFLFVFLISSIHKISKLYLNVLLLILGLFSVLMVKSAYSSQKTRRVIHGWDKVSASINAYKNSDKLLKDLGITNKDKIMVLYPIAPNIPFILMNRKGYAIQSTSHKIIENALNWDFDYITVANAFLVSDIINEYPDFIKRVNKIGGNKDISVYKLNNSKNKITLLEFLELDTLKPLFRESINFDTVPTPVWENTFSTDSIFFSEPSSGVVNIENTYGITIRFSDFEKRISKPKYVYINAKVFAKKECSGAFVISIDKKGENIAYKPYYLNNFVSNPKQWNNAKVFYNLPLIDYSNTKISIYIWNPKNEQFFYDDLKVVVY